MKRKLTIDTKRSGLHRVATPLTDKEMYEALPTIERLHIMRYKGKDNETLLELIRTIFQMYVLTPPDVREQMDNEKYPAARNARRHSVNIGLHGKEYIKYADLRRRETAIIHEICPRERMMEEMLLK